MTSKKPISITVSDEDLALIEEERATERWPI